MKYSLLFFGQFNWFRSLQFLLLRFQSITFFLLNTGLLGTNNNERFDEFRLPNNKLATSVTELANSWLVSKDAACRTWQFGNEAPTCNKSPSDRCQEVFKTSNSPFAKFFDVLDTRPFFQACQVDSADCEIKVDAKTSHCNATEAYRHMLRLKGIRAPKIADCGKWMINCI